VDRNRIIADAHRMRVLQVNAQGSKTVLVDGFVRAIWEIEVKKKAALILIDPLEAIAKGDRAAIVEEAEQNEPSRADQLDHDLEQLRGQTREQRCQGDSMDHRFEGLPESWFR